MANKRAQFTVKGMSRDLAVSKFNPEFAFENKNLRLVSTDDNTTFSLVNERGNVAKAITWDRLNGALPVISEGDYVFGTPIGQCVINDTLVLFTAGDAVETTIIAEESEVEDITETVPTEEPNIVSNTDDNIYKFWFDGDTLKGLKLFQGDLNFSTKSPIEALGMYENESLQKVYWTDGSNQPRVINVASNATAINSWNSKSFDFVGTLSLNETVSIEKDYITSGIFAPGTIQYCFTYYNLYGQQTNIFYTSPLYYVSFYDRGANPTETVSNSFNISIGNLDHKYNRVRIYSIHRTSINTTPTVRVVADIAVPTSGTATYMDNGISGYTIDPTELLYIGGKELVAGCLNQKDNTLFLGNLHTKANIIPQALKTDIRALASSVTVSNAEDSVTLSDSGTFSGYYKHENQLRFNSQQISGFKASDYYRIGLQFQDSLGNWSETCYITDKQIDRSPYISYTNGTVLHPTRILLSFDTENNRELVDGLRTLGYVKVRPVIVYPTLTDRVCLCQGVVNPTVFNVEDRYNNAIFAQASWFFRPNSPLPILEDDEDERTSQTANNGKWAEFRHLYPIPSCRESNSEIQCINIPPDFPTVAGTTKNKWVTPEQETWRIWEYKEKSNPKDWVPENRECYYIDQSIVTLNSPDIEFDPELQSLGLDNTKFRITGALQLNGNICDIDIQTSTPPLNYDKGKSGDEYLSYPEVAPGFYKKAIGNVINSENAVYHGWKTILSGVFWLDDFFRSSVNNTLQENVGFVIYPWHRNNSLNNTDTVDSSETKSALLSKKKTSVLRYSSTTNFFDTPWVSGRLSAAIYNNDTATPIKINLDTYTGNTKTSSKELLYQGNIDKVVLIHTNAKGIGPHLDPGGVDDLHGEYLDASPDNTTASTDSTTAATYPIMAARFNTGNGTTYETNNFRRKSTELLFSRDYGTLKEVYYDAEWNEEEQYYNYPFTKHLHKYVTDDVPSYVNDPVSIKYKSTPHAVIVLGDTVSGNSLIENSLPAINGLNRCTWSKVGSQALFWNTEYGSINQPLFQVNSGGESFTPQVGFLYLGELYRDVNTSTIFGGNTNEAIENNTWIIGGPSVDLKFGNEEINIKWNEGDTFYQRYDCLKTYPFTMEDQNSVVDILSFLCETRVNIDGRYDRNRGQTSNLYMSPLNFNLLNTAYSQRNNFFSYRSFNPSKLSIDNYPNLVTWTKTKTLGEEVDSWTNITLASTLDLDGDKGPVRDLKVFNDALLAFQDSGISQILYNDNVQIATATGVPIEIANSGKVSGKRYISNKIGCTNKWSICTTSNGIYFVDDRTKDIYLFNEQIESLSDKLGFRSWMIQNFDNINIWNPEDFEGITTNYDAVNQDVFFTSKNYCLAFNEALGQFTSFYSYEHVPYFANLKDRGISWQRATGDEYYKPWMHQEGEYNKFFNIYQPFWTTVIVNPENTVDKIFNTVEFRADSFTTNGTFETEHTFDHLRTWNEYQEGVSELVNIPNRPSSLKKKFRIWHANIPRWNVNKNGQTANYRDRMRNPWLYLKLSMEDQDKLSQNYKTVLHDLIVDYTE